MNKPTEFNFDVNIDTFCANMRRDVYRFVAIVFILAVATVLIAIKTK